MDNAMNYQVSVPPDLNESMKMNGDFKPTESFKNPWTTISRPMNGFMDLNPVTYER